MRQEDQNIVGEVRGHPLYRINPSLAQSLPIKVKRKKSSDIGSAYKIVHNTGEIVAEGAIGFWEDKEVDTEQFVKIYLAGIKQYGNLTKAGAKLFEYVYEKMSGHKAKDTDTITISLNLVRDWHPKLAKATYYRGLNELLDQGFLFRYFGSEDMYFVNIRYIFNGDRVVLAQSYRRKSENNNQSKLLIKEEEKEEISDFQKYDEVSKKIIPIELSEEEIQLIKNARRLSEMSDEEIKALQQEKGIKFTRSGRKFNA
jgi:hypothetical protein